jgi:hypothetical protein
LALGLIADLPISGSTIIKNSSGYFVCFASDNIRAFRRILMRNARCICTAILTLIAVACGKANNQSHGLVTSEPAQKSMTLPASALSECDVWNESNWSWYTNQNVSTEVPASEIALSQDGRILYDIDIIKTVGSDRITCNYSAVANFQTSNANGTGALTLTSAPEFIFHVGWVQDTQGARSELTNNGQPENYSKVKDICEKNISVEDYRDEMQTKLSAQNASGPDYSKVISHNSKQIVFGSIKMANAPASSNVAGQYSYNRVNLCKPGSMGCPACHK